jgi:hypothetical protein
MWNGYGCEYMETGLALRQLDQLLPIGTRAYSRLFKYTQRSTSYQLLNNAIINQTKVLLPQT